MFPIKMDQSLIRSAPYFDAALVREEADELARRHAGQEGAMREALRARLKPLVEEARGAARRQLLADGDGRGCAEGLAAFQDELIRIAFEFATCHVYRSQNPSAAERMAILATGGYGRGLLAPYSDIDLLFLLPYKQTAWGESVAEYLLYLLWDLGFKVGHATRSIDQCVRAAQSDMTVRTALLDSRLVTGDASLYAEFETRFRSDVAKGTGREFIEAKLDERNQRHKRSGASRYLVEPNIKDGKGGLRDLHTLHWIASYLHPVRSDAELVDAGVLSAAEYRTYRKCEDFLWRVRCHLHFLTDRAEERLSFDVQAQMAELMGYRSRAGLIAAERFMKHYFLVAKEVGVLTRTVCQTLETKQLKAPGLDRWLKPSSWRRRAKLRRISDFRIESGRINAANRDIFAADKVNFIRLFALAERNGVSFDAEVLRLVRSKLSLIDDDLRNDPGANRLFLRLLTESGDPEGVLRRMNEAGVLGRFIPDFGRIVSMMQFNMYHHFTVDEHLLRTVGVLAGIERGDFARDHPVSSKSIPTIDNRRALYVAAFLHDIAKGRDEDHSIAGARIARELGPRFGLTQAETDTAAWLVEQHLTMSYFAQSRDLNDPKTIRDFASIVQSRERLKLLLILTVCDIRAVGPGVWNGWKGQLLRNLYFETEPLLGGGQNELSESQRVVGAQGALRAELEDWSPENVDLYLKRHHPSYWLRTDAETQVEHALLAARADGESRRFTTRVSTDAFKGVTELTVYAPSHPKLLSAIAGACAAAGANIVDAQISTTRDGMALDTIHIEREFDQAEDEERRATRIAQSIEALMQDGAARVSIPRSKRKAKPRLSAFSVAPQVAIDNTLSDELTVIEINGLDRPGLLYAVTSAIEELRLDIASAHIATFGEKAIDVFYVTDLAGRKILGAGRHSAIRQKLLSVLGGDAASAASEQAAAE
jgi:[protein-PII] uridylyltransferase